MKTILFHVNSLLAGGIEKVLIELLNGLDPSRYHIKLSIAHHLQELEVLKPQIPPYVTVSYILDTPILTNTKKKKVTKTITPLGKLFEDVVLPVFKKRAHRKKLKKLLHDVDVVVDYDMTLAPYHYLLKDKKTAAYCHFSLAHYWDGNKRKLDKLAGRLAQYDKVVMLCDEMKNNAAELYPFLEPRLVRIYNALNTGRIAELAEEPIEGFDQLTDKEYFLSVGRLAESQKDFTTLIKGYALAVKQYNIKELLVIAGEGYSRQALETLATEEGVGDRVIFTGFQQNPYKWMKHCKLFLFCSKYEGLPTVLIEALSLNKPIIATACPTGVQETLMYGKAGILIAPADINALASSIHKLANDTVMQQNFLQQSQQILSQFRIENMVLDFEKLIVNQ